GTAAPGLGVVRATLLLRALLLPAAPVVGGSHAAVGPGPLGLEWLELGLAAGLLALLLRSPDRGVTAPDVRIGGLVAEFVPERSTSSIKEPARRSALTQFGARTAVATGAGHLGATT